MIPRTGGLFSFVLFDHNFSFLIEGYRYLAARPARFRSAIYAADSKTKIYADLTFYRTRSLHYREFPAERARL